MADASPADRPVGQYLCEEIRPQVGSQIVDTVYARYLKMWDELSDKPGRVLSQGYGEMTMKGTRKERVRWSRRRRSVFVPIQMFFMRTSGNALPLIALSFHGVKITLKTNSFAQAIANAGGADGSCRVREAASPTIPSTVLSQLTGPQLKALPAVQASDVKVELSVGYVYLGVTERNKFAEASFEILIDQVQKGQDTIVEAGKKTTINNIGFNHCVQELMWAVTKSAGREAMDFRGELDGDQVSYLDTLKDCQLKLNNSKRFTHLDGDAVPATYFRQLQPYMHHTRIPDAGVYAYSFAITPESNQPSGSANFSRIDNSSFEVNAACDGTLHMFARNWNVFRISLGLGGLVWAS